MPPSDLPLALNTEDRSPLYYQIFEIFRRRIRDGHYSEGDYLPGEREISEAFKVSRITAVRALNELAACNLVVRERGRGTRVRFVASGTIVRGPSEVRGSTGTKKVASGIVDDFADSLRGNTPTEFTVHAFGYGRPPPEVAAALQLAEGAEVQSAVRVSRFAGRPYHHLTTFVPAEIGRNWTRDDLFTTPLSHLLARAGVRLGRIDEFVTATIADPRLVEQLEIEPGAPLLKITRTATDVDGRRIEHLIGFYPPDRYQYGVSLTPHGGGVPIGRGGNPPMPLPAQQRHGGLRWQLPKE